MSNPVDVTAAPYNADPTGAADATTAIQNAISAGLADGPNVRAPCGRYMTSAPLVLGTTPSNGGAAGWKLYGDGCGQPGLTGTTVTLNGTGLSAIIEVNDSAWMYCGIEKMFLHAGTSGGISYGILFNDTAFSARLVSDVRADGVGVAFGIVNGSGGNGEFNTFERCRAQGVDGFFYSNAGQAYVQRFDDCNCGLNVGGTYFKLDMPNGGGGLVVTNFNASGTQQGGISNTLLLDDLGSSSPITFIGGRVEKLTQIIKNPGGSAANGKPVLFEGMEFTIDFDPANPAKASNITEVVSLIANAAKVVFKACVFRGVTPSCEFPIYSAAGWGSLVFEDCQWQGFAKPPYLATDGYDEFESVRFVRCRRNVSNTEDLLAPFHYSFIVNCTEAHPKEDWLEALWLASGLPGNLLTPMALTTLGPGQSAYQDITALDLSTNSRARDFNGTYVNTVAYRGKFSKLGGAGGTIALVDSVSGQIYDQFQIRAGGTLLAPVEIALVACVKQGVAPSYVRLLIQNTDASRTLTIQPEWQFAEAVG